ncbi:MAG: 30S ribosome-binding factor RbfA [Gemmatimonadetes bacterium]|nr:30S ribosome-binding factor RbfA [Gemmatimonadota bacterium]
MKRIDDVVRRVIGEALLDKVADPRIGLVSVTRVEVSPEFDTARVWVTVLGDSVVRERSLAGLRSAAPFLQSEIAKAVRMRRVPRLRFLYDDAVDRGFRVDEALRGLGPETESGETGDGDGGRSDA